MPINSTPLNNKSAVITGSTSGIGLAIAETLAAAGVDIMLNGLGQPNEIEALMSTLSKKYPVSVHFHPADMTKPEEIADLIESAQSAHGGVDILINNAGIQHVAPVDEFPIEKWDAIIAINLSAAFHSCRAALPLMKEKGWGRIINIASAHGLVASPYKSAYVAAKHGILGLTKTVAMEVAQQGITCNAICPGYVRTALVEAQIPNTAAARGMSEEEVVQDVILAAQPTKSFVGTDELGGMVQYLCSDAARSVTGAALSIDGGWTAN